MIKFEHTEVVGWEHAIRGMRNPMNSWEKSDSFNSTAAWDSYRFGEGDPEIGPNDLDLMMQLRNAGTDHRKFMRMITVYARRRFGCKNRPNRTSGRENRR